MAAPDTVTVWFPVDPEHERRRLLEAMEHHLAMVEYAQERAADWLAMQGYRLPPREAKKLDALRARFAREWAAAVRGLRIEHVGAPQGKVAPPEAHAHFAKTGQPLVTVEREDGLVTSESRSRH